MKDRYGRTIEYMRISITDRCNLRCRYCMPDGIETVDMKEILTYEEIVKITEEAAKSGIRHIKITGGEPLVRKGCTELIRKLKNVEGIETVTMTTNGILLKQYLGELQKSGIDGINVSLDTTNPKLYREITGSDAMSDVLDAIVEASKTSIPVKVNAVLFDLHGDGQTNAASYLKLLRLAEDYPVDVRFIEGMPIGRGKAFPTISSEEVFAEVQKAYPSVSQDTRLHGYGPAKYYTIDGFRGSIGFISAIHGKFCDSCNRIRLSAVGFVKPCLCYGEGYDLKDVVRNHPSQIQTVLQKAIYEKPKEHCFEKEEQISENGNMISIGG
ncbi:MAG: GTP 3',8-cyclase MoaA [Erysipelotrichaceae bacterium]|nr:GTP 3',8-cyclase MoaA [Erysipelotrichaceae bacterium]